MSGHLSTPGTPAACTTAPIPVQRHVDEDWRGVTLDLTHQTDLLTLLARAIIRGHLLSEFLVLGRNENSSHRQAMALRDLLDNPGVRDALTLTLDGDTAEQLGDRLCEAGVDRACQHCGHRNAMERAAYCPGCQVGVDALDAARAAS